ncbi:MAG TPA: hypothetical protein PLD10_25200 [Rhodopila sp.]|nr:hypothetical protein [Rhodopila sp.]
MRRLLLCCAASVTLYVTAFACVLDRPLSLGALRTRIEAGLARGTAIRGSKLVILAGSNGPYSHRCEIIEPLLGRPCVNAGIAVGVGLDYLFTRWKPLLHPGDIVYLPLEEAQYSRPRATAELGPDAAIMLRHDRTTLWMMPTRRQIAALFASDLRGAVMSVIETALEDGGFQDPRAAATGSFNVWGDHVGHTAILGAGNRAALSVAKPFHPSAAQIRAGYGSVLITDFLAWASAHNVMVVGGLPTGFADSPIPGSSLDAIRAIYRDHNTSFLELPNRSRYPRDAFFDTPDHLNEATQILHSIAVGLALARLRPHITDRRSARFR